MNIRKPNLYGFKILVRNYIECKCCKMRTSTLMWKLKIILWHRSHSLGTLDILYKVIEKQMDMQIVGLNLGEWRHYLWLKCASQAQRNFYCRTIRKIMFNGITCCCGGWRTYNKRSRLKIYKIKVVLPIGGRMM